MPEISGVLLLILFFGFSLLRKKAQQATSKTQNPAKPQLYQPVAMPAFPEAAPAMPVRPAAIAKSSSMPKKAAPVSHGTPMEGDALDWKSEKQETPLNNPLPAPKPQNRVVPYFSKESLVQAIVMHEILTRPKHAVAPYLRDYPPRV